MYTARGVQPAFPFGHGLSYTTFTYSGLSISGRRVSCQLANTGAISGIEVAQLYLRFPAAAGEPPRQLKGFESVSLPAGGNATLTFELDDRSFSIWDVSKHAWAVVRGSYGVLVGSSSEYIRLTGTLTV